MWNGNKYFGRWLCSIELKNSLFESHVLRRNYNVANRNFVQYVTPLNLDHCLFRVFRGQHLLYILNDNGRRISAFSGSEVKYEHFLTSEDNFLLVVFREYKRKAYITLLTQPKVQQFTEFSCPIIRIHYSYSTYTTASSVGKEQITANVCVKYNAHDRYIFTLHETTKYEKKEKNENETN